MFKIQKGSDIDQRKVVMFLADFVTEASELTLSGGWSRQWGSPAAISAGVAALVEHSAQNNLWLGLFHEHDRITGLVLDFFDMGRVAICWYALPSVDHASEIDEAIAQMAANHHGSVVTAVRERAAIVSLNINVSEADSALFFGFVD